MQAAAQAQAEEHVKKTNEDEQHEDEQHEHEHLHDVGKKLPSIGDMVEIRWQLEDDSFTWYKAMVLNKLNVLNQPCFIRYESDQSENDYVFAKDDDNWRLVQTSLAIEQKWLSICKQMDPSITAYNQVCSLTHCFSFFCLPSLTLYTLFFSCFHSIIFLCKICIIKDPK